MSQNMAEGQNIDETAILKDILRKKKESLGWTNQDVADRSGLSIHTVTNYFSTRSKSSSAYTVGKICMALQVSMDNVFGIEANRKECEECEAIMANTVADLHAKYSRCQDTINHKDEIIKTLHAELHRKRPSILSLILLSGIIVLLFAAYVVVFDITSPDYGLIKNHLP